MALKDILDEIKQGADEKIEKLTSNFADEKKKIDKNFENAKKKAEIDMKEKVQAGADKISGKMKTVASMKSKNQILKAKRKVIDETFESALDELLSSAEYVGIITGLLKNTDIKGEDIQVIPAKGKESETEKALKESGKNYKMGEASDQIRGGFILTSEKIEINNSFEAILNKQLRDSLELVVAKKLFPAS